MQWETKVWGSVWHLFKTDMAAISYLKVKVGFRCSKHYHEHRVNHFAVVSGIIEVEEWDSDGKSHKTILGPGDVLSVIAFVPHRFNVIKSGIVVEYYNPVSAGGRLKFTDIIREDEGGPIES